MYLIFAIAVFVLYVVKSQINVPTMDFGFYDNRTVMSNRIAQTAVADSFLF